MRQLIFAAVLGLTACPVSVEVVPEAGVACTMDNAGACESSTRLLVCQGKIWSTSTDCKGPDGCRLVGDAYECDLRGNSLGDLCPAQSEGKVRCDPDGGVNILRCKKGVLNLEFVCPQTTVCQFIEDAGLTCR